MPARLVLPSADDPVVAGAVEGIGGPPGRHARLGDPRFWTPVRVLLALTLMTCVLGWMQKAPCRDGSQWQHEYQYTRACYTDVVALYSAEGLAEGKRPYYDHPVEYPVVIGGVMRISAAFADLLTPEARGDNADYRSAIDKAKRFYDVTWLLLTVCALIGVVTTARLAGNRVWDAAMFALAPGLLLHGTTNWDLIAVALSGLALLAWARSRPLVAGALLGVAAATKLYPALFLVPLFLLCLRAARLRAFFATALATIVAAAGLTLPVYLTAPSFADVNGKQTKVLASPLDRVGDEGIGALFPRTCVITSGGVRDVQSGRCPAVAVTGTTQQQATNSVWRFVALNQERPADWDSLYLMVQRLRTDDGALKGVRNWLADRVTDSPRAGDPTPHTLNRWVSVWMLLLCGALAMLVLYAPRRPRLPQVLFLFIAGFLLVNKVNSPQYVIWLLPLAVLARPRWRMFLAWQAAEIAVVFMRFYYFIYNDKAGNEGVSARWFFGAVLLRDALLIALMALVAREVLHPEHDRVRRDGVDDPTGGVLEGAPDRALSRA